MTINLPCYDITVYLTEDGGGSIRSSLSIDDGELDGEVDELEYDQRKFYNAAMDGIESLILAHACAGIDISSPAYLEGIETAVEACGNNL